MRIDKFDITIGMDRSFELIKRIELHKAAIEKAQQELLKEVARLLIPPPGQKPPNDPSR